MSNHEKLEYQTCKKCGIQQQHKNFWYSASAHDVCKYCNKKTNVIPTKYETTSKEAHDYLSKILFDPKNNASMFLQTQMNPVLEYLKRKHCEEMENMRA